MEHNDDLYDDDEAFLEEDSHGLVGAGFAAGLLLGAALGVGLALLYAPDKGSRTRRRIGRRVRDWRDSAEERLDDARREAGRELGRKTKRLKGSLTRAKGRARDAIDDVLETSRSN